MFNVDIRMNLDTVAYFRSVYNIWNWLGDIGGLFGSLYFFGDLLNSLISLATGNGLTVYLIKHLYKFEAPKKWRDRGSIV